MAVLFPEISISKEFSKNSILKNFELPGFVIDDGESFDPEVTSRAFDFFIWFEEAEIFICKDFILEEYRLSNRWSIGRLDSFKIDLIDESTKFISLIEGKDFRLRRSKPIWTKLKKKNKAYFQKQTLTHTLGVRFNLLTLAGCLRGEHFVSMWLILTLFLEIFN